MKLKIGLAQNILYQFNIFCTGTKTNCTKVQIELQHDSMKNHEAVHPYSVNFNLQNYFLILPFLAWELLAVDSLNLHLLGAL